jgi:hypothetical protein
MYNSSHDNRGQGTMPGLLSLSSVPSISARLLRTPSNRLRTFQESLVMDTISALLYFYGR